jgi:hypothetical protein
MPGTPCLAGELCQVANQLTSKYAHYVHTVYSHICVLRGEKNNDINILDCEI